MNLQQLDRLKNAPGFIAALDQSGGSTPGVLKRYGAPEADFQTEEGMYKTVHAMRTRIIKSPAFSSEHILGAILFEHTMDNKIDDQYTADYLWNAKGIVPFLKIDKGLDTLENGVQLMKPMPELDALLQKAQERHIFGTKMRSVIKCADEQAIEQVVAQQFEIARKVISYNLVPIVEPEVDIHLADKAQAEELLKASILKHLNTLTGDEKIMLKLTLPEVANTYAPLIAHERVVRVVALSGGYSREESNRRLSENKHMIASFSRALSEGLTYQQTEEEFNDLLGESIVSIFNASMA